MDTVENIFCEMDSATIGFVFFQKRPEIKPIMAVKSKDVLFCKLSMLDYQSPKDPSIIVSMQSIIREEEMMTKEYFQIVELDADMERVKIFRYLLGGLSGNVLLDTKTTSLSKKTKKRLLKYRANLTNLETSVYSVFSMDPMIIIAGNKYIMLTTAHSNAIRSKLIKPWYTIWFELQIIGVEKF